MEQLALTIDQAVKAGGPRRAKLYDEIRTGRLRAVKVGRSTRILISDFQAYMASLPPIEPKGVALLEQKEARRPRRRRRPKHEHDRRSRAAK
jgi:excisionase family DNA binding protein